MRAKMQPMRLR